MSSILDDVCTCGNRESIYFVILHKSPVIENTNSEDSYIYN